MACSWDFQFRVLLLGNSGVGKTSLLGWYTNGEFSDSTGQTVGVDFCSRIEEPEIGVKVRLQFWDTAGQERYRAVTRSYYRNAAAVILLFDLTARPSFESIVEWYQEVTDRTQPHPLFFLLLGTKNDLQGQRAVTREEGQRLADTLRAPYLETSARSGSNISAALTLLSRELLKIAREERTKTNHWSGGNLAVETDQAQQRKTCAC
ncbi:ras-related protein Rab-39B-like [Pelodytes ibericus]